MAIPGILLQMAKSNPKLQQIKQMMGMVNAAQNPMAALNQMAMSNPQLKQAMDLVNQYGGDPNRALGEMARQYGLTEQDVYDLLK